MKQTRPTVFLIAALCTLFSSSSNAEETVTKRILLLGDSLTAGYGIDPEDAYPALLAEKMAETHPEWQVAPSGLSGETSAGGLRRASWVLQKPAAILVLALGANDGLRGIELSDTKRNLQRIIDLARDKYPEIKVVIAGMQMPPNLGAQYTTEFRKLFPALAEENDVELIPFLLEGVAGHPQLNIADGIHPNEEGHEIIAENVWRILEPLLE